MIENRPKQILQKLRRTFTMPEWTSSSKDPFKTLIATIISQNTTSINAAKAFENLSKQFKITPEVLANAQTRQIEKCLKVAGLYRKKAKTTKQLSELIIKKFRSNMQTILSLPFEQARNTLLQLPGVGLKTADIVMLFCTEKHTIPVDTHVDRVTKRLGLTPVKGDYETVRKSLQSLYSPKDYLAVHVLLIQLGRKICKARKPSCKQCPLNMVCPSKRLEEKIKEPVKRAF